MEPTMDALNLWLLENDQFLAELKNNNNIQISQSKYKSQHSVTQIDIKSSLAHQNDPYEFVSETLSEQAAEKYDSFSPVPTMDQNVDTDAAENDDSFNSHLKLAENIEKETPNVEHSTQSHSGSHLESFKTDVSQKSAV